ncbi:MAG: patatin family protein [Bacilli bacterium]|nr:patatin family protein [Bacilli bacterium]
MNKTCLVLEGGAMRGIYTAGVLDTLMQNNIKFDAIIGVSAGALFGINYKSNQKGRAYRYNMKYINDKEYIGLYSYLTTGNIMNKSFCFDKLVNELDKFDYQAFKNNKTKFYVVVTNLLTGTPEYQELTDLNDQNQMEYLRASGSMQYVSKPVKINNNYYLDGATGDSIPIKYMEKLGFNKIIVVGTRPEGYKKQYKPQPSKIFYKKYPKFIKALSNRPSMYNETIKYIEKKANNHEIIFIRPSQDLKVKRIEKNKKKLSSLYTLGQNDTKEIISTINKYLTK